MSVGVISMLSVCACELPSVVGDGEGGARLAARRIKLHHTTPHITLDLVTS